MLHWLIAATAKTFHTVLFLLRGPSHYVYYSAKSSADSTMALPTPTRVLEVNCSVSDAMEKSSITQKF